MKVLQLSYRLPWPLKDGGAIGIYNLTKAFHQLNYEVTLLSFNTKKQYVPPTEAHYQLSKICTLHLVDVNTNFKIHDALISFLKNTSYHINRFINKDFENKIIDLLKKEKFDLIQIEGVFMAPYINLVRKHSSAKIFLRAHNIEHHIWGKLAANSFFLKKYYLNILARQLKQYEIVAWAKADLVEAINDTEMQTIKQLSPTSNVALLSAGVFIEEEKNKKTDTKIPLSIFHIGGMDWLPNIEAVDWFLQHVWPIVQTQLPNATFYLAGKHMPKKYFQLNKKNVIVIGEVENAFEFMSDKELMIVPLLSGGGVRIKIIEAMSIGKAIVATHQAAEGLNCTNNKNIIIADKPTEMANKIIELLKNNTQRVLLENEAKEHIQQNFNQPQILKKFLSDNL